MSSTHALAAPGHPVRSPLRFAMASLLVAGSLATCLQMTQPAMAQNTVSAADYVPATALVYGEVELDQESDQYVLAQELLERANIQSFMSENEMHQVQESFDLLGQYIDGDGAFFLSTLPDLSSVEVEPLADDAAAIAEADPKDIATGDIPQGWAVVYHPSDAEALFTEVTSMVAGEEESEFVESEYEGYTILSQAPADEYSSGFAVALVDDIIAFATTPEDLQPVIDTANGTVDPISGDEHFQNVRGQLEDDILVGGYVNGPALLDAITEQAPAQVSEIPEEVLVSLGGYQGVGFWAEDAGFRVFTVAVPAEGADLPEATAFEPAFTQNIDADSLAYSGGTDLGKEATLDMVALLFASEIAGVDPMAEATPVDPEAYADEVFAEAEGSLGFNIKTDLLDQLVGEWGVTGTVDTIVGLEPNFSGVLVSEVDDTAAVEKAILSITNMAAASNDGEVTISARDVSGSDVTVIETTGDGMPLVFEFGVVDNQLLIGVNEGIDSFLGDQSNSLADDGTFQDTVAQLPEEYTSLSYLNVQGILPLIDEATTLYASSSSMLDNDPACEQFDTQEDAQEAYDEDDIENFNLDLDWDGEACEDFFNPVEAEATPAVSATDVNVLSIGTATYNNGDSTGTSTIILIGE